MNRHSVTTIKAGADYSGAGGQYHAIALLDGQLANSIDEVTGILLNKPADGEHAQVAYEGEIKYAAGGAITKGDRVTVSASGWFTEADSNEVAVGHSKVNVTSGSLGVGIFSFPSRQVNLNHTRLAITPKKDFIAGTVMAFNDFVQADSGGEADAVVYTSMVSGTAGEVVISGVVQGRMDAAECSSIGDALTVTTAGYFTKATSGSRIAGKALENISSDTLGNILFHGSVAGLVS